MKNLLLVLLCINLISCATTNTAATKEYVNVYNEAVASGRSVQIIKEGDIDIMKEGVEQDLDSVGYNKVLYSSPTESFMVLVKSIDYSPLLNSDIQTHKIFLKYTKIDAGHTRIDLVNGGEKTPVKNAINNDIQKLTDLIKNVE